MCSGLCRTGTVSLYGKVETEPFPKEHVFFLTRQWEMLNEISPVTVLDQCH